MKKLSSYAFHQNNSGGLWAEDMPIRLVIMAKSAREANRIAESMGVYFDGCERGIDCPCCGDRWTRVSEANREEA